MDEKSFEDASKWQVILGTQSWVPSHIMIAISTTQLHWNAAKKNSPRCHLADILSNPKESHLTIIRQHKQNLSSQPIHIAEDPDT